jgi:hypothetical protein
MASRLHKYSANNTLLILIQRPDATAVAGYREWQKMGRQVRKGSQAIWILAPNKYKIETENEETGEKDTAFQLRGFRPAGVFALEDTDGPEIPRPALLAGEAPAAVWDGVVGLLQEAGYSVSREEIETRANGDTNPTTQRVRVDSRLSPFQALKTLDPRAPPRSPWPRREHRGIPAPSRLAGSRSRVSDLRRNGRSWL